MNFDVPNPLYVEKLEKAIKEHMRLNPLRNDLDAYLYAVCEYALLKTDDEPRLEDYGLSPNSG